MSYLFDLKSPERKHSANRLLLSLVVPVYDPPPLLNVTNSTSDSFSIRWKPYSGDGTLIGYRVIVLRQSLRKRLMKREATPPIGDVLMNFSLPANVTSIEIGNLSASTKFCVRIGAILFESNDDMSECVYIYTKQGESNVIN